MNDSSGSCSPLMAGGVSDEALHTLIARLRNKIEPDRKRPSYIISVRGEGYKFVEPSGKELKAAR